MANPSQYAKLPKGTKCYFSTDTSKTEAADMIVLDEMDGVGETGKANGFVECTPITWDGDKQYINDQGEGPDKAFVLLDNPTGTGLLAFQAAADAQQEVNIRYDFPNKRFAVIRVLLGNWSIQELDKSKPMYIVVNGKQQELISRGVTA